MLSSAKTIAKRAIQKTGYDIRVTSLPVAYFQSNHYMRHNARRLEHLASLRIPVAGKSVLEVGAGIGDHSHYYLDRGCTVTITEARADNLKVLRRRYPACQVQFLDLENPLAVEGSPFNVVHCYGLLYHLNDPARAIEFLAQNTKDFLFLETCVSFGTEEHTRLTKELAFEPTQAYSGIGCRPTRQWLFSKLREVYPFVYLPKTQPCHEEFPLNWNAPAQHNCGLQRAIFIASRAPLKNELLTESLIMTQQRHE